MTSVLFREPTPDVDRWLAERRAKGLDRFDEVWEGVYVVVNAPRRRHGKLTSQLHRLLGPAADAHGLVSMDQANIGSEDDFRIPDYLLVDPATEPEDDDVYTDTAALVVEVRSPREDPAAKLPFYWVHEVGEVVLLDPDQRTVRWLARADGTEPWIEVVRSPLLDLSVAEVVAQIRWA